MAGEVAEVAEVVGVGRFVRRLVLGSLGLPYHYLRDYVPARHFDHWGIAAIEPGVIPDATLLAD